MKGWFFFLQIISLIVPLVWARNSLLWPFRCPGMFISTMQPQDPCKFWWCYASSKSPSKFLGTTVQGTWPSNIFWRSEDGNISLSWTDRNCVKCKATWIEYFSLSSLILSWWVVTSLRLAHGIVTTASAMSCEIAILTFYPSFVDCNISWLLFDFKRMLVPGIFMYNPTSSYVHIYLVATFLIVCCSLLLYSFVNDKQNI